MAVKTLGGLLEKIRTSIYDDISDFCFRQMQPTNRGAGNECCIAQNQVCDNCPLFCYQQSILKGE